MEDILDMKRFEIKDTEEQILMFKVKEFQCMAVKSNMGHWCAYIIIPEGHRFHGQNYEDIDIDCHGGLTYEGTLDQYESKLNGQWAIGWDYAHAMDVNALTTEAMIREDIANVVDQL